MTASRSLYECEIVFDKLNISWELMNYDGRPTWHIQIWCRAMNNNATTSISVDYDGYIKYWMEGKGPVTMRSTISEVHLGPKDYEYVGFDFLPEDDPNEFTELEYGFAYGGLERGYLNRTIHPKRS